MKDIISKALLVAVDFLVIVVSIILAYQLRFMFDDFALHIFMHKLSLYLNFPMLYIIPLLLLAYEGIYTKRLDFWQECWLIIKAIVMSSIIIFAYLAATQEVLTYSRLVIILSLLTMVPAIAIFKIFTKKLMYKLGLWSKKARVYGCDKLVKQEVFSDKYLGYSDAKETDAKTVFINGNDLPLDERNNLIAMALASKREVVFIPTMQNFDLSMSYISKLQNTRTNLVYFQNRLTSKSRIFMKNLFDIVLVILLLPLILPIFIIIFILIKIEDYKGSFFYKQTRMGKNGKKFQCYKFRSMYEDSEEILQQYILKNPDEIDYYDKFHKYKNDPRITKIGQFLRKTSLDELPQIFNIVKGEMSFIGPRPYMIDELDSTDSNTHAILEAKPGITGLWQVSGRSGVDFKNRIRIDVWYVLNWSLWLDFIILLKTAKVVLKREGAY